MVLEAKTMNNVYTIQKPEYSIRLYRTCYLMLVSMYSAWVHGIIDCFALSILVFSTSILYWRFPVDGWRRKLDMICANGSLLYQTLYKAPQIEWIPACLYYSMVIFVVIFYRNARFYGRVYHDYDMASRYHMLVHIFGNMGNLVLYQALHSKQSI